MGAQEHLLAAPSPAFIGSGVGPALLCSWKSLDAGQSPQQMHPELRAYRAPASVSPRTGLSTLTTGGALSTWRQWPAPWLGSEGLTGNLPRDSTRGDHAALSQQRGSPHSPPAQQLNQRSRPPGM